MPIERDFLEFRRSGDTGALARVFDALAPELLLVAAHLTQDQARAEDLVQDTFVQAIESAARFDPKARLRSWLTGILVRKAKKAWRQEGRKPDPDRLDGTPTVDPTEEAEARELAESLSGALQSLPAPYRQVLNLRLVHGLSAVDISRSLERTPATVHTQLRRGLEMLRKALPRGFAIPGIALLLQGRGLTMVRRAVIERAETVTLAATTAAAAWIGGPLLMKKLAVVVVPVLAVLAVWSFSSLSSTWSPEKEPLAVESSVATAEQLEKAERDPSATPRVPVSGSAPVAHPAEEPTEELTLAVRGTVFAPGGGNPLPGAAVFLSQRGSLDLGEVVAHTDDSGQFVLENAGIGRHVAAFADGYTPCELQTVEGDPGTVLEMRFELMLPGSSVQGLVLDPVGTPVADARIMIGSRAGPGGWMGGRRYIDPPPLWLQTDVAGRFETHSAQRGATIHVYKDGLAPWTGKLGKEDEVELVVRLSRGGTLTGRLVDPAGNGVPAAFVYTDDLPTTTGPPWSAQRKWTDGDGRFRFEQLPPGELEVGSSVAGYRRIKDTRIIVDGGVTDWYPILQQAGRIVGRLVDDNGVGLSGFSIRAVGSFDPGAVTTGDDGAFAIEGCEESSYTLRVYHPEDKYRFPLTSVPDIAPDTGEQVIRISDAQLSVGSARGVLQHPDGRPLGRVPLALWPEPYRRGRNLFSEGGTGKFHFQPLPPGLYRLDIRLPEYAMPEMHFTVSAGEALDLGDILLETPGTAVVHVTYASGAIPWRHSIAVVDPDEKLTVGRIEIRDGVGRSDPLTSGRYTLIADSPMISTVEQEVRIISGEETAVYFDLPITAERTIRFLRPGPEVATDLELVWRDGDGREINRFAFRLPDDRDLDWSWYFAPGTYRLEAVAPSGHRGMLKFSIRDGDPVRGTIELELK